MSDPFFIWTMRRTGGTTFAGLLADLSEHQATEHEPFNLDRRFGHITQAWATTRNSERLFADLDAALESRPLIKHCYELVPESLNQALLEATTARGYRHIILDRASEVDRIISLELAKATGAWGVDEAASIYGEIKNGDRAFAPIDIDSAREHLMACASFRRWLAKSFESPQYTAVLVYFEEIYREFEEGRRIIEKILDYLGIEPKDHADYETKLVDALTKKSQKSQSISHAVPNLEELRTSLMSTFERHGFRIETSLRDQASGSVLRVADAIYQR